MTGLSAETCEACRVGAPVLGDADIAQLMPDVPGWQVVQREGVNQLEKVYRFANFADALAFTNRVGAIAESADHHPALITEWGQVTVTWWSHKIKGLHRNDFIMAARTEDCVEA